MSWKEALTKREPADCGQLVESHISEGSRLTWHLENHSIWVSSKICFPRKYFHADLTIYCILRFMGYKALYVFYIIEHNLCFSLSL